MAEKTGPDIDHLEWAIDQRAKIQHTLLALYSYAKKVPPEDRTFFQDSIFDSLLSASFALWRAVFLADRPVTEESLHDAQTEFLATVLSTNAITFNDDRRNSAWSLGFYMQAASLHIHSAAGAAKVEDEEFADNEVLERVVFYSDQTVRNSRRKWEGLHGAIRILFNKLLVFDDQLHVDPPLEYDYFL
jgi:hypothetical protein